MANIGDISAFYNEHSSTIGSSEKQIMQERHDKCSILLLSLLGSLATSKHWPVKFSSFKCHYKPGSFTFNSVNSNCSLLHYYFMSSCSTLSQRETLKLTPRCLWWDSINIWQLLPLLAQPQVPRSCDTFLFCLSCGISHFSRSPNSFELGMVFRD